MSDRDTVILVPMLTRAHRVAPLLASVRATCSCRVLFLTTPHDDEVVQAVLREGYEHLPVAWEPTGDYARKINTGIGHTTEPLIFTGADDLEFHPGWLDAARAQLAPGIGVVGVNDLGSPRVMAGRHATHFLVTRDYVVDQGVIDEPGKLLYEGYVHEFVDDELVGTARHRGAWAFAADSHVRHRHPNWDPSVPIDELYAAQSQRIRMSQRLFYQRSQLWA